MIEWSNRMLFSRQRFEEGPVRPADERGVEGREERPREGMVEQAAGGPDISGTWDSSVKRTYEIAQSGREFTWTVMGTNEKTAGVIEGDHIVVEWSGGVGSGRAEGHIAGMDETGRVVEIEWSNGVIFTRPAGAGGVRQTQTNAQASVKAKIAAPKVDIIPAEISSEALKMLMPHLSLKSVFNEWVKVGGPIGGLGYDVRHLSNSQRGKRIMLVTDNYSGVNKSVDGGENWFASNTGIKSRTGESQDAIPVFSLTVDPNDPNIVWAGLKDKKGVYKSIDAGATWIDLTANVPIPEPEFVFRGFTIMPGDSKTVFAQGEIPTSQDGLAFNKVKGRIYLTRDGGNSWKRLVGRERPRPLCDHKPSEPEHHLCLLWHFRPGGVELELQSPGGHPEPPAVLRGERRSGRSSEQERRTGLGGPRPQPGPDGSLRRKPGDAPPKSRRPPRGMRQQRGVSLQRRRKGPLHRRSVPDGERGRHLGPDPSGRRHHLRGVRCLQSQHRLRRRPAEFLRQQGRRKVLAACERREDGLGTAGDPRRISHRHPRRPRRSERPLRQQLRRG